ncbi:hypothetical protein SDC9_86746 [bioreactor metagenome]|uniref:Uncharacterized protein n=1 Tax=bioreactor metagenome TaxID=1076179 RepID=A0A644ZIE8_9ZZZZ
MEIVILDGYAENPGDLDWGPFEKWGKLTVYDRTPENLIIERVGGAQIVLTNKNAAEQEDHGGLPRHFVYRGAGHRL